MKKQEQLSFQQLVQDSGHVSQLLVEDSQYLDKYNQYFSHKQSICQQICIFSANNLHKYGIRYTPESPYQPFKVSIQSSSKNSEIIILSVIWGHFSQRISIINYSHENSRSNRPNQIHYNANTTLYEKLIHGKSVMFKSQLLTINYRPYIILSVIKELFLAKIGSALGFGPYCHMETFFDLFIYDNCIEFGMEKCIGFHDRSFDSQSKEQLMACLLMMHFFRIIHYDIKPGNIMFSKYFNKYVLIDFNLSDVSNLQLGKKTQMPFRGTVNFCCPEMVHNFLAAINQLKKVDAYYNDVFCLQQSIKLINVEKRRIIGAVRFQYLCDMIEENEEENAILFIKKTMYLQQWGKVYQFFSHSIFSQKFFQILIEFLYELDFTENLQIFYVTIIPSGLKETFFTKQFEYLLRKKWMVNSGSNSMMMGKKIQYASRLEFTPVDLERSIVDFNKEETKQYLNNYEKFTASKVLYFSIFLEYVSISSNRFGVDHNDRKRAARKCISFISEKEEDHREATSQGLFDQQQKNQSLIRATMMILEQAFAISQQGADNDHSIVSNLLLQLLPFIIILDIGSLEQSLKCYEQILDILQNDEDRLCFLLSLKQLNEWSKNRIGKKGTHSRYGASQKTKQFAILGLRNFNPTCSPQLKKIIQFALRQNLYSDESTHIQYDGSHLSLKRLVKKQQFDRYLQLCTQQNSSIQKICKLTRAETVNGHLSFEHSYFGLYQRYKLIGGLDFCEYINKIYQQNLNDKNLERRFNIYYKNMGLLGGTSKQFLTVEIENIEVYLNEIEDENIGLLAALAERTCNISEVIKHNRQELTFQEYYSYCQSFQKIHCKLKSLLETYYRFRAERKGMKVHECFNPKQEFDLYVYDVNRFQTFEQCRTFFKDLMLLEQFTNCCYCAFAIECFIVVCQQTWVVVNYPSNSLEIFANLQEQMLELKSRIFIGEFKFQNYVYFKQVISHMTLNYAVFCTFEKEYEMKHKGLRTLYHAIKQEIKTNKASLVWIYMGDKQMNKALLEFTMRILFEYQFDQLINFLVLLARHLDKNIATSNFNMVLLCFTKLLISINFHQQLAIEQHLRTQVKTNPQIKNHLTIYFYCLAMDIRCTVLQQRLYFSITPTLANFPFDLQIFYSSAIYLYFVKKLRNQEKKSQRKQLYLNNKLVKLMLMKWESKIEKGKKYPTFKNIYMRLLVKKLKRIEGPISTMMDTSRRYIYSMKHID